MESRHHTDALLARAQDGDRSSFDELVESIRDALEKYARLRLGAHLREYIELDDVLQETYSRAFRSLGSFRSQGEGSLLRWFRRIAENVILEAARRQRRDQVLFLERDVAATGPSPSEHVRRDERFDRFERALESLPDDYREIVMLSRIEGLRIKEIAERTGRTPKAIGHVLSRAMARLRDAFGDTESFGLPHRQFGEGGPEHD